MPSSLVLRGETSFTLLNCQKCNFNTDLCFKEEYYHNAIRKHVMTITIKQLTRPVSLVTRPVLTSRNNIESQTSPKLLEVDMNIYV